MKCLLTVVLFSFIISFSQCARILGVFQMPTVSHQCVFQSIWKELSLRGHKVTVITPYTLKDPALVNLTEIEANYTYEVMERHGFQYFMSKELPVYTKIRKIFELNYELSEAILNNTEFIKIYNNSNEKFDLIIAQTYVSPILYSLSAKLKAPIIGVSSMGGWIGSHFAMGNPNPPSLYSEMFLPYNGELNLYERFCSTLYYLWTKYYLTFEALPRGDQIARKYLGNDIPYLADVEKTLSILFLTTNPILYTPRPTVPTVISLQQLHIKPAKALPTDLQHILDDAKEGAVYFSLGSNVKSVNMSERLRNTIIEAFAELPYTVLWKWEGDNLPNKPKNIIVQKWLPQQDILAHPNIKVFITQCGLQSTEEAIARGVPVVGIPFIADQPMNLKRLVEVGVAVGVDFVTVTKEELKKAVMEVVDNNKKYKTNIQNLQKLLMDEPMTSIEKVIWWSEYVIRHKGTKHLRSPTVDISWFKYFLVDVSVITLIIILTIGLVTYKVVKIFTIGILKFTVRRNKRKQN